MAPCPRCDFANDFEARVCGRCGADLLALAANDLPKPLPEPMTEPVHTPTKPPPDSKPWPLQPALTVSYGGRSVIIPCHLAVGEIDLNPTAPGDSPTMESGPLPAAFTVPGALDDRLAPGASSSHRPGTHESPMTDAVQPPPQSSAADTKNDASATPLPPAPPPKLLVLRGLRIGVEYPIYEGRNSIGRFADKPVDIDLVSQESVEQIWCSRQHAVITYADGVVSIEDLNSLNGTWVNGGRIHAGQRRPLRPGDIIQIGTVQMKLMMG